MKEREENGHIPKYRPLVEFLEMKGEKVGTKNKSIFKPYSKAETEYFASISKYEHPLPFEGHLGKFHGAGLENKITNI